MSEPRLYSETDCSLSSWCDSVQHGVADRLGEPISEDILNNRGFSKIPKSRGFLRIFEVFEVFSRFIVSSIYYYIYVFYMYKVSVYMYYLVHIT